MSRILIYIFTFLFAALSFSSCQMEEENNNLPHGADSEVFFSLNIPQIATDITRAISEANEQTVETIDILAFDAVSDKFLYHVTGTVTDAQKIKAKVQRITGKEQRFVFLINARSALTIPTEGADREAVLEGITLSLNAGTGWTANSGSDYTSLPMWGTIDLTIPEGGLTAEPLTTVNLYRSLARIQLKVDEGVSSFTLNNVYLYRSNLSGRIAPANGKIDGVSLPNSVSAADNDHPIPYSVPTGNVLERSIYTFERANKGKSKDAVACLVVEGEYNDIPCFYRIDFRKENDYIDFIRNYSYTLTITAVTCVGYDSATEALNGASTGIEGTLQEWNSDGLVSIAVGEYYLSVDKNEFELDYRKVNEEYRAYTAQLVIKTNYSGGWKIIENFPDEHWLDFSPKFGEKNEEGTIMQLIISVNEGEERTESFIVKAGTMMLPITVKQKKIPDNTFLKEITIHTRDSKNVLTYDDISSRYVFTLKKPTGTLYAMYPEECVVENIKWEYVQGAAYFTIKNSPPVTARGENVTLEVANPLLSSKTLQIEAISSYGKSQRVKIVFDIPVENVELSAVGKIFTGNDGVFEFKIKPETFTTYFACSINMNCKPIGSFISTSKITDISNSFSSDTQGITILHSDCSALQDQPALCYSFKIPANTPVGKTVDLDVSFKVNGTVYGTLTKNFTIRLITE